MNKSPLVFIFIAALENAALTFELGLLLRFGQPVTQRRRERTLSFNITLDFYIYRSLSRVHF
jgi:hypothetical protein